MGLCELRPEALIQDIFVLLHLQLQYVARRELQKKRAILAVLFLCLESTDRSDNEDDENDEDDYDDDDDDDDYDSFIFRFVLARLLFGGYFLACPLSAYFLAKSSCTENSLPCSTCSTAHNNLPRHHEEKMVGGLCRFQSPSELSWRH